MFISTVDYLVYTERDYLDRHLDDINLDRDPQDALFTRGIHCFVFFLLMSLVHSLYGLVIIEYGFCTVSKIQMLFIILNGDENLSTGDKINIHPSCPLAIHLIQIDIKFITQSCISCVFFCLLCYSYASFRNWDIA